MNYRAATPADIPAIDALFRDSFTATFGHLYRSEDLNAFLAKFTHQAWAAEMDGSCTFRLAQDAEGLAGFVKTSALTLPAETAAPARELRQLYVAERAKGSGTAQALIDWTIADARGKGAAELWLSVYTDNHRAKRFYARNGFEDMGPYVFMVGSHADEDRLMRRKL